MLNIDKLKLPKHLDRRRKLTDKEKKHIKDLYFFEYKSIREIAREYDKKCSRRLIQFILFPERDKKLKEIIKETKGHLKYYDRKKQSEAIKNLRAYKRKVFNIRKFKSKADFKQDKNFNKINKINNERIKKNIIL